MKKLFTLISAVAFSSLTYAQTMGIVGQFTNWGNEPDIVMTSSDGTQWEASGVVIDADGGIKFRLDSKWSSNWGGKTFPTGTAEAGGMGNDIPGKVGKYDVTFNTKSLEYSFTAVATEYDKIGFTGLFNSYDSVVFMSTLNGVDYFKENFFFSEPNVLFKKTASTDTLWGGTGFPSGTAKVVPAASDIPLKIGYYNVSFNKKTLAYNFEQVKVGLIGSAIPPYDWSVDVPMESTDGGITHYLYNYTIKDGLAKFRANGGWGTNWGGGKETVFPADTAFLGGGDITVSAGTYKVISFNRFTGEYYFGGTVCNTLRNSVTTSSCKSYSYNGKVYDQSGQYVVNLKSVSGCDSIVTLNLTINKPTTSSSSKSSCDSYLWNGKTYYQSGIYTYKTINKVGCDSIATLNLTINNPTTSSSSKSSCDSYLWNGKTYDQSGTYTYKTTNKVGCDSTATLNLTISNIPQAGIISVSNDTILSIQEQNGFSYQWINCANDGLINEANSSTLSVSKIGSYAVIVSNQCGADTSNCQKVEISTLNDTQLETFRIYPNPTDGELFIESSEEHLNNNFELTDFYGRVVLSGKIDSKKQPISLEKLSLGCYILKLANSSELKYVVKY
jgi:hypothetical protein